MHTPELFKSPSWIASGSKLHTCLLKPQLILGIKYRVIVPLCHERRLDASALPPKLNLWLEALPRKRITVYELEEAYAHFYNDAVSTNSADRAQ